jgi:predicted regulator of Ras-like GTPase activity (Roadblock/LC7/MglB family)
MREMTTLPQLTEEDVQKLGEILREFNAGTDATVSLLIDQGGFLLTHQGDSDEFDLTSIAALAFGAYMANQTIAGLVSETKFNSTYQQGEKHSLFVINVDEYCLLVVIFKSEIGVGVVKYYAATAIKRIARQLKIARKRAPGERIDLSMLNIADTQYFFRKKEKEPGAKKRQ